MKLSEFIKETLVEIANGAKMADEEYAKMGAGGINPVGNFKLENMPCLIIKGINEKQDISKPIVFVEFKLNIQLEETEQINGKIGGILNIISASVGASKEETNKSVQEVSFSIPLTLPSKSITERGK